MEQSLTDLEKMFSLMEREREIADVTGAQALKLSGETPLAFENVSFAYDPGTAADPSSGRAILHNISFELPKLAVGLFGAHVSPAYRDFFIDRQTALWAGEAAADLLVQGWDRIRR